MDDSKQRQLNYVKDTRIPCKYGADCYQKNPFHSSKYKHPPKTKIDHTSTDERPSKKRKTNNVQEETKKISNDVSDSEEESTEEALPSSNITSASTSESSNANQECSGIQATEIENGVQLKCKIATNVSDSEERIEECGSFSSIKEHNQVSEIPSKKQNFAIKMANKELVVSDSENETKPSKQLAETNLNVTNKICTEKSDKSVLSFDKKQFIKAKFLVEMPTDFYSFWEFCKKLNSSNPLFALKEVGLILVGPFDVMAGKFSDGPEMSSEQYLIHWRYFYDPPEFQTVLKGDDATGYHIGYFRDDPNEAPVFLAYNNAKSGGVLSEIGDNVFAAVSIYLDNLKKSGDPFKKMHAPKFQSLIKLEAERLNLSLAQKTAAMRKRDGKIVTRTFNKIGLVVPYNKKTQLGYRELTLPDKELKQLLDKLASAAPEQRDRLMTQLQPVLTYASIATDECDFGTGIELGWNILFSGIERLNSTISSFLVNSYELLDRHAFALIAAAHMRTRRKGSHLSIL